MNNKEYLVGINYFNGWWRNEPNKWNPHGKDWRMEYPERIPLLGMYNDQATMDAEIQAAQEYGVDFFQILWYPPDQSAEQSTSNAVEYLNTGIGYFMESSVRKDLKFTFEYCNHEPFAITDLAEWEETCEYLSSVLSHPSYLKVGGRPVFKIHGFQQFVEQCGNSYTQAKKFIDILRNRLIEDGVGELLLTAGITVDIDLEPLQEYMDLFDFFSTYMGVIEERDPHTTYPYEKLSSLAVEGAKRFADELDKPYMPYIPSGWNPRPWNEPRPSFDLPDRKQWNSALTAIKELLDSEDALHLPDGTPEGQKVCNIYAWNEFGEGGMVAPTVGERYMKLEEIKKVFKA